MYKQFYKILYHTAAVEGRESFPGWGWVTLAPKIIVGRSLTSGIRLDKASTRTVFIPPTLTLIFKATFARYCLVILKTCFVKQYCETIPRPVSQILFRSPSWIVKTAISETDTITQKCECKQNHGQTITQTFNKSTGPLQISVSEFCKWLHTI